MGARGSNSDFPSCATHGWRKEEAREGKVGAIQEEGMHTEEGKAKSAAGRTFDESSKMWTARRGSK
jgi:hypothetical protein